MANLITKFANYIGRAAGTMTLSASDRARFFGRGSGGKDVSNPFEKVVPFYAGVRLRATALASLPMRISDADDRVIENGPLAMAVERPNAKMTRRKFWQATSAYLDLFGKCYWIILSDGHAVQGYTVRSELEIQEKRDTATGEITGYVFTPIGGTQRVPLTTEEVHPVVMPNYGLGDLTRGIGPRMAAAFGLRQHYKADIANDSSLDNGAGGGLGLRTEKKLTVDQKRDLEEYIAERNSGVRNRHKWMLLQGGLSVEKLFNTFAEMEFAELKRMSRDDICVALGLSPTVLGYPEAAGMNTGKTVDQKMQQFWTLTIIPLAVWLAEEWDDAIGSRFANDRSLGMTQARGRDCTIPESICTHRREMATRAVAVGRRYYAWFDTSTIYELQQRMLAFVDSMKTLWEIGVPTNQMIDAFDLPFKKLAHGELGYKPLGIEAYGEDTLANIDDPAGSEEDLAAGDKQWLRSHGLDLIPADKPRDLDDADLEKIWTLWRTSWSGLYRAVRGKRRRLIKAIRDETLANLSRVLGDGTKSISPDRVRDVIGEIMFDVVSARRRLVVTLGPLLRESHRLGGEQSMQEASDVQGLAEVGKYNISDPRAAAAMREHKLSLAQIETRIARDIREELTEALKGQETVSQIAERLRSKFNIESSRAATVARTEVGRAVEAGRHVGREQAGVPSKSWLWSRKESGRPSHMATELATMDEPVPNSQNFTIAGTDVTCPHPRATNRPEHDIECGCTTLGRHPKDNVRTVVRRYIERGFLTYEQLIQRDQQAPTRSLVNA